MTSHFSTRMARHESRLGIDSDRPKLDLFEEASVMTSPAAAIKTEIRELIDLQIQVFGQPAPLTVVDLEDCRCRAERIESLGRKLDQLGMAATKRDDWRRLS